MLRFNDYGMILIYPEDDCDEVVDSMLEINYQEDFCLAFNFDPLFVARMMEAGFLVMSVDLNDPFVSKDESISPNYILLPR